VFSRWCGIPPPESGLICLFDTAGPVRKIVADAAGLRSSSGCISRCDFIQSRNKKIRDDCATRYFRLQFDGVANFIAQKKYHAVVELRRTADVVVANRAEFCRARQRADKRVFLLEYGALKPLACIE
jgi:hypothetical protein